MKTGRASTPQDRISLAEFGTLSLELRFASGTRLTRRDLASVTGDDRFRTAVERVEALLRDAPTNQGLYPLLIS